MDKKRVSDLIAGISPSATESTSFLANQLRRKGIDIISFAQGEPDFDTPDHIKQAAVEALEAGFTKYTDVPGIPELKEAVAVKLKRENGITYDPDQIVIASGAKQALYEIFRTILNPGDQVLIPTPCYVSYAEQIKLAGGEPVFFDTKEENNFRPQFEEVQDNYTSSIKAFIINSPTNPTGSVFEEDELKKIADFLAGKGVYLITDEVYEHMMYDGKRHVSAASMGEKIQDYCIVVNSVSKTYAMTGWRVGYAAGPRDIIQGLSDFQGHASGNINSIAQKAAVAALLGDQQPVKDMAAEYTKRKDYMVERLNAMPGITCRHPDGAFYTFPNVTGLIGKTYDGNTITNDVDVAKFFLEKAHVAVVPGAAFNSSGYVRFVFAKSMKEIKEGLDRIERSLSLLS